MLDFPERPVSIEAELNYKNQSFQKKNTKIINIPLSDQRKYLQ